MNNPKAISVKPKNSFEEAYSLILKDIINGTLKPGEIITEVDLSERYGLSRTPVREAISRFQCEGLINTTNRTKRICSLTIHDLEEIFELKKLIEGNLAKRATESLSESQAQELRKIVREMKDIGNINPQNESQEKVLLDRWLHLDKQFHELIFKTAGNNRAEQYIHRLNLQWHRLKVGLIAIEGRIGKAIIEHEAIALAILDKEPEKARNIMTDHLDDLKDVIIKLMKAFNYSN